MAFEKAYCLYRLNRTQEALAALTKEANIEAKHKELKAQILYRMEKWETLFTFYVYFIYLHCVFFFSFFSL